MLVEGDRIYLYGAFCPPKDASRHGPMVTVLGPDMLTVVEEPRTLMPSAPYSAGSGFEGHEYYEAASIRKIGQTYYFIYSSIRGHELCYATSDSPAAGFKYRGVVVSNVDAGIDRYKPAGRMMAFPDNNHGSIARIAGQWYVFYHRHTNGHCFSRQACLEPIEILPDGSILQAEITSCGPNGGPLPGEGTYPAYIACNICCEADRPVGMTLPGKRMDARFPRVTQDGRDGDEIPGHVANMDPGAMVGFKFFDCESAALTAVTTRGYCGGGAFEVLTSPDGEPLGRIPVGQSNDWKTWTGRVPIPDGMQAIYLRYSGSGCASLLDFTLKRI